MTEKEQAKPSDQVSGRTVPTEAEIVDAIQKAARQYEEYMKLADLSDLHEVSEIYRPKYSWDNPIGLAVTRNPHGDLR